MALKLLQNSFDTYFTIEQVDSAIRVTGPQDRNGEYTSFITALKGPVWNSIPPSTKIILRNILIDIVDHDLLKLLCALVGQNVHATEIMAQTG